jgi:hypothetical protein
MVRNRKYNDKGFILQTQYPKRTIRAKKKPPKPSAQLQYLHILILVFSRTDHLITDPIGARDNILTTINYRLRP